MEELVELLKKKYEIDDEAALNLASFGDAMIRSVLSESAKSNQAIDTMMEDKKIVNERMVKKALTPYAPSFKKKGPWYIQSAGDGNCSTTSIAGAMEIENTIRLILKLIDQDRKPTTEDGFPSLNFSRGSDIWDDGMRIRELYSRFYLSTDDKLNQELPLSMGKTTYTRKNADGSLENIERPMTRRDYICLEVQQLSRSDLNALTTTKALLKSGSVEFDMSPEGLAHCDALARAFVKDSSKPGVWCGWSMFYAVVSMRKPQVPLRIYVIDNNKIKIHLDMVPDGLALPSEEDDDVLHDNEKIYGFNADEDDDVEFVPGNEEKNDDAKQDEEEDEEDDEMEDKDEEAFLFPRVLYRPGHFDVLVSNHHKNLITHFWPETARYFQSVF